MQFVDDWTFRQLKESNYYHPEITEVIFEANQMYEMSLHSIKTSEKGYDIVWDKIMVGFIKKYFKDELQLLENLANERGLKNRLIAEVTQDSIDFVNSLSYTEIRHVDDLRGNFAVFDKRAYMVQIFHKATDQPDQAFWSNSGDLVAKQQKLFDNLWKVAMPLSARTKELEYQKVPDFQNKLTNYDEIKMEITNIIQQCRNEVCVVSSARILNLLLLTSGFLSEISSLLKRRVKVRILTNKIDSDMRSKFNFINNLNLDNKLQFGFSNQLDKFNEFILIEDSKIMLRSSSKSHTEMEGSLSAEKSAILVQEIVFEKYWNEIQYLEVVNSNRQ